MARVVAALTLPDLAALRRSSRPRSAPSARVRPAARGGVTRSVRGSGRQRGGHQRRVLGTADEAHLPVAELPVVVIIGSFVHPEADTIPPAGCCTLQRADTRPEKAGVLRNVDRVDALERDQPRRGRVAALALVSSNEHARVAGPAHCGAPSMARRLPVGRAKRVSAPVGANVVLQTRRGAAPRECTQQEGVVSGEGPAGWLSGTAGFSVRRDSRVLLALRSLGSLGFETVLGPVVSTVATRSAAGRAAQAMSGAASS